MNKSRTKLSAYNSISASIAQFVSLAMSFVSRTIFIKVLGEQYLGLNGLFTNVLSIISFAELGIGAAITYSLYEPIAKNSEREILSLMQLYKKVYHIIALVILVIGSLLDPFIGNFISGSKDVGNIQLAFFLFLLNTVFSYLWNYKRSIFFANQMGYINSLNTLVFQVGVQIIQIVLLFVYPSYYIYLIVQIIFTILSNFQISILADKYYPILKSQRKLPVAPNVIEYIKKNVIGMVSSKLGGIIVLGTDNVILSSFLGLATVGVYSNYTLILNGMNSVVNQGISAVTASIGNLQVLENKSKQKEIYYRYNHLSGVIGIIISIGLVTFFTPFIKIWVGNKFILDPITTWLIVIGFFVSELRQANINFTNAYGLYWEQRLKPIFESIVNLVVSLVLIIYFNMGIQSVVIGTLTSNLLVDAWWEPLIVIRYGLRDKMDNYFVYYFSQLITGVVLISFAEYLSLKIQGNIIMHGILTITLIGISTILYDFISSRFLPYGFKRFAMINQINSILGRGRS